MQKTKQKKKSESGREGDASVLFQQAANCLIILSFIRKPKECRVRNSKAKKRSISKNKRTELEEREGERVKELV